MSGRYVQKNVTHVSQFFFFGRLHAEFRQPFAGKTVGVRKGTFHARYVRHRCHFALDAILFLRLDTGLGAGRRTGGRRHLGGRPSLVRLVFVQTQRRDVQFLLFVCANKHIFSFNIRHVKFSNVVHSDRIFRWSDNNDYSRDYMKYNTSILSTNNTAKRFTRYIYAVYSRYVFIKLKQLLKMSFILQNHYTVLITYTV